MPVEAKPKPKEEGIIVEEAVELDGEKVDTSKMTETGVHKIWRRITGQPE